MSKGAASGSRVEHDSRTFRDEVVLAAALDEEDGLPRVDLQQLVGAAIWIDLLPSVLPFGPVRTHVRFEFGRRQQRQRSRHLQHETTSFAGDHAAPLIVITGQASVAMPRVPTTIRPARMAARGFRAPRFQAVYRAWQQRGDRVLDALISPISADAIACGRARLETVVLTRGYLHLLPLVGTA